MIFARSKIELIKICLPLVVAITSSLTAPVHNQVRDLHRAAEFLRGGDASAAASRIFQAASLTPWRTDLWEYAAELSLQAGDANKTIEILTQARNHGDLKSDSKLLLGDALQKIGDTQQAIDLWTSVLQGDEKSSEAHRRLALAYQSIGNFEQASIHLQALLTEQPSDPALNYELGIILAAIDPERSLAYLTLAGDSDPGYLEMVSHLSREIRSAARSADRSFVFLSSGRALASLGEWEAANEAFQRAIRINPNFAEAWAYLGESEQHLHRDGFPQLKRARALNPRSLAANTFLALYWQREGRYDLATLYLQVAEEIEPDNPAIQAELGRTLALAGKLQKAEAHYQRAAQLASNDPGYWRKLAEFSITYQYQVRQLGLSAARQALLLNPDDIASLVVMAQVMSLLGDTLSALRFLDRAIQNDNSYASAHLHLGIVYLLRGESQKASRELSLALELSKPDSSTFEHARRLLEQISP